MFSCSSAVVSRTSYMDTSTAIEDSDWPTLECGLAMVGVLALVCERLVVVFVAVFMGDVDSELLVPSNVSMPNDGSWYMLGGVAWEG
jgi:hypothetical protein